MPNFNIDIEQRISVVRKKTISVEAHSAQDAAMLYNKGLVDADSRNWQIKEDVTSDIARPQKEAA